MTSLVHKIETLVTGISNNIQYLIQINAQRLQEQEYLEEEKRLQEKKGLEMAQRLHKEEQERRHENDKAINDGNVQDLIKVQVQEYEKCKKNITPNGKTGDWIWFFFPGAKSNKEKPWGNSNRKKTFVYKRQYPILIQTLKNQGKLQYWISIFNEIITKMKQNKKKGKGPSNIKSFFHINPLDHGTMFFFFKTWGETRSEWGDIDQEFTRLFDTLKNEFDETQCRNDIGGRCSECKRLFNAGYQPI